MRAFVSGGCKNGKSTFAERLAVFLAKSGAPLYYIATMIPADDEDVLRIERHRRSRAGDGFDTVECPRDVQSLIGKLPKNAVLLLDSLTALLSNRMFDAHGVHEDASAVMQGELGALLAHFEHVVIVSDYIYADAESYDELTEAYRRSLAALDRLCAQKCELVVEVCQTVPIAYKGRQLLEDAYEKGL